MAMAARLNVFVDVDDDIAICLSVFMLGILGSWPANMMSRLVVMRWQKVMMCCVCHCHLCFDMTLAT